MIYGINFHVKPLLVILDNSKNSKEKFHNEIQLSIQDNELKFVRIINSLAGNLWVIQPSKNIQYVYDKTLDMSIPFDLLDIQHNETMEFLFVIANYGIKEFDLPNEMLLTVPRL